MHPRKTHRNRKLANYYQIGNTQNRQNYDEPISFGK